MSFFSKSSKGHHYRPGNYGSNHYQKNGLLGNLFGHLISRSGSGGHYNNHGNQCNNMSMPNQNILNQSSINCNKCGVKIPSGSKFCLECGNKVQNVLFCSICGETVLSNSKFCHKCGNKLME